MEVTLMCACGEVANTIPTFEAWQRHVANFPGREVGARPDPPFYVISIAINAAGDQPAFLHHFFGLDEAKELVQIASTTSPRIEFVDGSISGLLVEILEAYDDTRGWIVELARRDQLRRLRQRNRITSGDLQMAYLSMTKAGEMRGPHSHVAQTDVFVFVSSKFEVFLWDDRPVANTYRHRLKVVTDPEKFTRVIVPAGVVHAYRALDKDGLTANCPDQLYRGWDKKQQVDEVRWEDRPDSPFQPW